MFSLLGSHYRENWPLGALGEPIPKCPNCAGGAGTDGSSATGDNPANVIGLPEGEGFQQAAQRGQGCIQKQSPANNVAQEPLAGAGSSWGTAAEFLQGTQMPSTDFARELSHGGPRVATSPGGDLTSKSTGKVKIVHVERH